MVALNSQLKEKSLRLQELVNSRSKAYCSEINSSAEDVKRETEIDELEEEINQIEKELLKNKE
jgi:hypothetical protein